MKRLQFVSLITVLVVILILLLIWLKYSKCYFGRDKIKEPETSSLTKKTEQDILAEREQRQQHLQLQSYTVPYQVPPPIVRMQVGPLQQINYSQIGLLTSDDPNPIILPLFGRQIRSDRWQYYTATNKTNMLRIPLRVKNRDCDDPIGCDTIYNGDILTIDIYQGKQFTATIYKTENQLYTGYFYKI